MVSQLITDGDKNKKPIDLAKGSLLSLAECYEQLRECEKSMIAEGYQESLLDKGKKIYGPLIKIFANRSDAKAFTRR